MEIEKTLFRVHERFLFNDSSKKLTMIGSFVFFVLGNILYNKILNLNINYKNIVLYQIKHL
jgi:hypothetical protein